jgi:predicted Zn-ribbon and HTH transcriptional regulator
MFRTKTRCRVCGFAEIRTDAVVDRTAMLLAECPRCEHRWTEPPATVPAVGVQRVLRVTRREVASAA